MVTGEIVQQAVLVYSLLIFGVLGQATTPFKVDVDVISSNTVRLSWEGDGGLGGDVKATRFRVFCCSQSGVEPIEASTYEHSLEVDHFVPGNEYSCEVHPIFEGIAEGLAVSAAQPGRSNKFTMTEAEKPEESVEEEAIVTVATTIESSDPAIVEINSEEKTFEMPSTNGRATDKTVAPDTAPDVLEKFSVRGRSLSATKARLMWESVEYGGVPASRYRVACHSALDNEIKPSVILASTQTTNVEIDAFTPGMKYTCSVYATWDEVISDVNVVSIEPGISNEFTMLNGGFRNHIWRTAILVAIFLINYN